MPRFRAAISAIAPILLLAASAAAQSAAPGRTFNVTNPAELAPALRAAKPGDTVLLQPGQYGSLDLRGRSVGGGVILIRSASASSRAQFTRFLMQGAAGIVVSGVDVQSDYSPMASVSGASHITLTGIRFRGSRLNLDPWDDNNFAVHIRNSSNVKVVSSEFQDLRGAIYVQRSNGIAIRRNSFTYLREGLNIARMSRADISNNIFHSFSPNYGLGEHADAIQFWTSGEEDGSSDVTINQNYIAFGGSRAVQGIFIRSERGEAEGLPIYHRNFTVSGNVYYGSSLHGITLSSIHGTRAFGNVVVASPWADNNVSGMGSVDGRSSGGLQPQLRLPNGRTQEASKNLLMGFPLVNAGTQFDNIDLYDTKSRVGDPWTSALVARPTETTPPLSAFKTKAGSVASTRGIGLLETFETGPVTLDPAQAAVFGRAQQLP